MNYNTQNAKIASITEKALIVGIDVGSETHYARSFIQSISFAIELAGDLPGIIRTLLLVLSIKDATICCAQGQNIYVEKRGADPPMFNQT